MITLPSHTLRLRLIGLLWLAWILVLPLAHLTGLRNALAVLTILASLTAVDARSWRELPARYPLLFFLAWAALSLTWSIDPTVSFAKLKSDLLIPLLAYGLAYGLARRQAFEVLVLYAFAGAALLLALVSTVALLPLDLLPVSLSDQTVIGIAHPMPAWYPGTGDASAFVLLSLPALLAGMAISYQRHLTDKLVVLALLAFSAFVARNRNVLVLMPATTYLFAWLALRWRATSHGTRPRGQRAFAIIALLVLCASAFTFEWVSRERLIALNFEPPPWGESGLVTIMRDPRPGMWEEYVHLGMQRPLVGVGYGRTLPSEAYHTQDDEILRSLDKAAHSHAHNVIINLWLQLGVIGVALAALAAAQIVRVALGRLRDSPLAYLPAAGLATLFAATLARNMTDDFLIFGIASAVWTLTGTLLGWQARLADEVNRSS